MIIDKEEDFFDEILKQFKAYAAYADKYGSGEQPLGVQAKSNTRGATKISFDKITFEIVRKYEDKLDKALSSRLSGYTMNKCELLIKNIESKSSYAAPADFVLLCMALNSTTRTKTETKGKQKAQNEDVENRKVLGLVLSTALAPRSLRARLE